MRVILRMLLVIAAGFAGTPAFSQTQAREFYELGTPLPTDSPGKIEVTEFFWYGCPHCYALEPSLDTWVGKLPKDVVFRRVPAMFNENWAASARIYYALEAMGQLPRLHRAFFDAIHKDNLRPTNDSQVADWMKQHGVDPAQFESISKSFATESRLKRATQLLEASKIDGVPAIVVQGRYVVNAADPPSRMLGTVERFIDQARKELPAPQASEQPKAPPKSAAKPSGKS
jgi:thiol:disulfide interchange protein DsbA